MATGTVRFHRVLRAKPERVYRAFVEPDAKAKWLPPYGFTCTVHHMDARVGGTYKMSFRNFTSGNSHSWTGGPRAPSRTPLASYLRGCGARYRAAIRICCTSMC